MATGYTTKTVTDLRKFEKQTNICSQKQTNKQKQTKEEEEEEKYTHICSL